MAISLRFAEASPEMTALKAALVARSYEVFLCDEAAGDGFATAACGSGDDRNL